MCVGVEGELGARWRGCLNTARRLEIIKGTVEKKKKTPDI
jgi:hypothetical protein